MLWFIEYVGGAEVRTPPEPAGGLATRDDAVRHGKTVTEREQFLGFWVSSKLTGSEASPVRAEYYAVHWVDGRPVWQTPVFPRRLRAF